MNQKSEANSYREKMKNKNNDSRWSQYGTSGFNGFLEQVANRLEINIETFLIGSISLLLFSIALLFDQLALYVLALLFAPILSPILSIIFGLNLGSLKFIKIGIFSLLLNGLTFFVVSAFSGFIARQFPEREFKIWQYFIEFNWAALLLLLVGILIMVSTILKNPRQASLVANVALGYSFYLPLISSGFAFGLGYKNQFFDSMQTFLLYYGIAIIFGVIVLFLYRIRPMNLKNYWGIAVLVIFIAVVGLGYIQATQINSENNVTVQENVNGNIIEEANLSEISTSSVETESPKQSPTFLSSATVTLESMQIIDLQPTDEILFSTSTATITLTPLPTIIWAEVKSPEGNGANVRLEPGFTSNIIRTVLNGTAIQILEDIEVVSGATWVHIRFIDGIEGWIVRDLIISATPESDW